MNEELFDCIYNAMKCALKYIDEVYRDDYGREEYDKLNNAIGLFYKWHKETKGEVK